MFCQNCNAKNDDGDKFCYKCGSKLKSDDAKTEHELESEKKKDAALKEALKNKYAIVREINHGGMGVVYQARAFSLERTVALKVLPPELSSDSQFVERFKREIKTLANMEHHSIVPIYDAGNINGYSFFTMKYIDGKNLAEYMLESKRTREQTAGRTPDEFKKFQNDYYRK
jgi:serine/threonine protein kinase